MFEWKVCDFYSKKEKSKLNFGNMLVQNLWLNEKFVSDCRGGNTIYLSALETGSGMLRAQRPELLTPHDFVLLTSVGMLIMQESYIA